MLFYFQGILFKLVTNNLKLIVKLPGNIQVIKFNQLSNLHIILRLILGLTDLKLYFVLKINLKHLCFPKFISSDAYGIYVSTFERIKCQHSSITWTWGLFSVIRFNQGGLACNLTFVFMLKVLIFGFTYIQSCHAQQHDFKNSIKCIKNNKGKRYYRM